MMTYLFDMEENLVGKGENAGNQHFLLFQRFQKAYLRVIKSTDCVW